MSVKPLIITGCALIAAPALWAQGGFAQSIPLTGPLPAMSPLPKAIPVIKTGAMAQPRLGERNPLKPPFAETFDNYPAGAEHDSFERYFEVINANGDTNPSGSDRSWGFYNFEGESNGRYYSKCAYLQYPYQRSVCDDWLIPRAIRLEAGKYYRVTVDASLYTAGKIHRFEVKMGEFNDAEGLNVTVIEPVDVTSISPTQYAGWFTPEYDGIYYMGIHGISDKASCDGGYLFMDNIAMEAARSGLEPSVVTDVRFVSDPNGTPEVTITLQAPISAIDGSTLSGPVTVTVKRDNTIIHSGEAMPGDQITITDAVDSASMRSYTFTASNSAGAGCDLKLNQFIGMSTPNAPVITSAMESGQGTVYLSWNAPATDVNGTAINPRSITYNIYEVTPFGLELTEITEGTTEAYIGMNVSEGEQKAAAFAVSASINDAESDKAISGVVFVGTPYTLPYANSFCDGNDADVVLSTESDEGVTWRMLDDYSDPGAQDGDGGFVAMIGSQYGQYGELSTGKIDLTDASSPYVSFYTYTYQYDENMVSVIAVDCATGERTVIDDIFLKDYHSVGWQRIMCPLNGCAGKQIRVLLAGTIVSHGYIMFDNMVVDELPLTDLAVTVTDFTPTATLETPYTVKARIDNYGAMAVESCRAVLYCDSVEVASALCGMIQSMDSYTVEFSGNFSATSREMPNFYVAVEANGDENPSDNISSPFNITFLAPIHPVAGLLTATDDADGTVTLSWDAPDLSKAAPEESMEDFESYPSFATELDGFTMVDADGGFPAGFQGVDIPVISDYQSFWTAGSDILPFVRTRGTTSLATMATVNADGRPIANDDWLISPPLYGGRQTISFWTCSQSIDYGADTFEVYASSGSSDISDFTLVLHETEAGEEWSMTRVSLASGTRYFAIRCTSDDRLLFTIDDISYIAEGAPRQLQLIGYNVYRNNERLNTTPVTGTTFTTSRHLDQDTYYVTAVYDQGESTASNVVSLGQSGIGEIITDSPAAPAEYFDLSGCRVSPDRLAPGIYIRRQGTVTDKIMVR